MKITAILGSPRKKGVTSEIAKGFLTRAKTNGADITSYFLNTMDFKGCQGCHLCKTQQESCVLTDDLTPALGDLVSSDIMVFASPIYFWEVTGQFKCFFDRTWSLVKPDYMTNPHPVRMDMGKKAVWISSQGDTQEKYKEVVDKYVGFLAMFGAKTHTIRAFGMGNELGQDIAPFMAQAEKIADQLTK
ncbi:MAG: flavodoxin family protein [Proteobacteria bacterium]|nr:flavodoxin family protein [Pseudomonadota bacterium]MBU4129242.1 flavodoxin family protein [Pseudomonadota bacterium]